MSAQQSISYIEAGHGDVPIVLLHGLFGTPENWRPVMDALGDEYRFLAPQFPINREPSRLHTDFSALGQLTDYVFQFFDDLKLEKAVLCGNSLGGQVAIDFCLRDWRRVDRLVITGSAGLFERSLSDGKRPRLSRQMVRDKTAEVFYDTSHVTDEMVDEVYEMLSDRRYLRFLLHVAKATRDRNLKEELKLLKLPTLIVWGKEDYITPPFVAEEFHAGIPNSELVFIDRCGHSPPVERPEEFVRVLRDFLRSSAAVASAGDSLGSAT